MVHQLRDAVRVARDLGASVEPIRRTGELRFAARGLVPLTHNGRRKDSSRKLRAWIQDLERLRRGERPLRATQPHARAC